MSQQINVNNPFIDYMKSIVSGNKGHYYKSKIDAEKAIENKFYVRVYSAPDNRVPCGYYIPNDKEEFFNNLSIQFAIKWHADQCNIEYNNTVAVGIVLDGKRKICVDVDESNDCEIIFEHHYIEFCNRLCEMFKCNCKLYIRPPYKDNKYCSNYKHGAHIILDALTNNDNQENIYQYIINDDDVRKVFYTKDRVVSFIDKSLFQKTHVFWIDGSCKPESHMYKLYDIQKQQYIIPQILIDELSDKQFGDDIDYTKYTNCIERDEYIDYSDKPIFTDYKIIEKPTRKPRTKTTKKSDCKPSKPIECKPIECKPTKTIECQTTIQTDIKPIEEDYGKFTIDEVEKLIDSIPDECITDGIYSTIKLPIICAVARNFEDTEYFDDGWNIIKDIVGEKWNTILRRPKDHDVSSFKATYYSGYKTNRDEVYTMGTVMHLVEKYNPSFYDEFKESKYGVKYRDWNNFLVECEFSDDEEEPKPQIDDKVKPKRDANLPFVQDWVLKKICEKYMKKPSFNAYKNIDDYIKDRTTTIREIKNYLSPRIVFLQTPLNTCYVNEHIEKNSDLLATWKNIGKIFGTSSYFRNVEQKEPTIDAINAYFNCRTVINKADFIPCNKIKCGNAEIINNDNGEKILNTFKGYNPLIKSDDKIPDLTSYEQIINDFINKIDGIEPEQIDYINQHPIYLRPQILTMLNISGGIEYCEYVKKFIAQIIQEPNNLHPIGILFYSRCRQGKGLLIKMISDIIGDEYVVECNTKDDLLGAHRVPFENTLLVNINEARASEFGKDIVDVMKSYIDGTKQRVANRKNIQAYTYTMRSRIIATTNNPNGFSFDVANGNDRINAFSAYNYMPAQEITRIFISKTIDIWRKQSWYVRELYKYFNSIKYTTEEILHIYETEYMKSIIDASVEPIEEWLQSLCNAENIVDSSEDDNQENMVEIYSSQLFYKIEVKNITNSTKLTGKGLYQHFSNYCTHKLNNSYKISQKSFLLELMKYEKYIKRCDKKCANRVVYNLVKTSNDCEF